MTQWYETLFENYARKYDQECFTQGTIGECDFIEKEIAFDKQARILDIACGTGRHTIELTRRGYSVVGIDLSESQLNLAREKAGSQNLNIDVRCQDARSLTFLHEFDLVIMLCEGGFPLMETDEMNFEILQNAAKALNAKGKLILTTLNGLFPLFHSVKEFLKGEKSQAGAGYDALTFDLMTFREQSVMTFEDDSGIKKEIRSNERYYVPCEISWLLKTLGFKKIELLGAKLGAFSRTDTLSTEDFEMLVIAE